MIPIFLGLILIGALAGIFIFRDQLPFAQPGATEPPINTEEPTTVIPTQPLAPVPSAPQFAPICQELPTKCDLPIVNEIDKFCVSKIPYTLLEMPEGSTFEGLSPELICNSEGVNNGTLRVSCRGPELISFDLKVCDSTCTFTGLTNEPTLCPQGHGYYAEQSCCAPLPPGVPPPGSASPGQAPPLGPGCTIFKVDIRQCN